MNIQEIEIINVQDGIEICIINEEGKVTAFYFGREEKHIIIRKEDIEK